MVRHLLLAALHASKDSSPIGDKGFLDVKESTEIEAGDLELANCEVT